MIEFGHLSHPGTIHDCNQSTYYGNAHLGVWAILDGVGGDGSGEFASTAARDAMVGVLRQTQPLEDAILTAETAVNALPRDAASIRGTTALIARTVASPTPGADPHAAMELAWLGSTLAFGMTQTGELRSLTAADAGNGPSNRTKALGVTQSPRLHINQLTFDTRDFTRLLLCSESVASGVGQERLREILLDREVSAQELTDTIIFESLEAQAEDSVTAIVLKLK